MTFVVFLSDTNDSDPICVSCVSVHISDLYIIVICIGII